eukprot:1780433-Amphidinium_carterae.1
MYASCGLRLETSIFPGLFMTLQRSSGVPCLSVLHSENIPNQSVSASFYNVFYLSCGVVALNDITNTLHLLLDASSRSQQSGFALFYNHSASRQPPARSHLKWTLNASAHFSNTLQRLLLWRIQCFAGATAHICFSSCSFWLRS